MFSPRPADVQPFLGDTGGRRSLELIQIKYISGPPVRLWARGVFERRWGTVEDDSKQRRYPLPCPVCKTAMIGQKSDPNLPDYDRFECFRCGAVVVREDLSPGDSTA